MLLRMRCFAVLVLVLSILRSVQIPKTGLPTIANGRESSDPESILALGGMLRLRESDLFALELLPQISDVLGKRILQASDELYAEASSLESDRRYEALRSVRGIGKAGAERLRTFIDLSPPERSPASSR